MNREDRQLVFVYGTLKRGCCNHGWMRGATYVGEARTQSQFRMFDLGGFPGLYEMEEDGLSIAGELWRVSSSGLRRLDILEDVEGGEYRKELIQLLSPWGGERALVYICQLPHAGCRDVGEEWVEGGGSC